MSEKVGLVGRLVIMAYLLVPLAIHLVANPPWGFWGEASKRKGKSRVSSKEMKNNVNMKKKISLSYLICKKTLLVFPFPFDNSPKSRWRRFVVPFPFDDSPKILMDGLMLSEQLMGQAGKPL